MAYNKTNWQNSPSTSTPINATNLNNIENGIKTNDDKLLGNTPMGNIVVDSIRSKNMLNPSASISGAIANNSTSEATDGSTSAITSGWMLCKPNTSYTLSGGYNRIRWQSKAENNTITFIGENLTTITTNSTAKWIRVYFYYNSGGAINPASITNIQVEEGTTATTYSPYQDLNNQETYSLSEIRIGTWIDGKTLYRNVFTITNPQSSNTNYFNVSNLHIQNLIHLYGYYKSASGNIFDIPFYDSDSNYSVVFLSDAGYIRGRFGSPTNISEVRVIIEYTKTTD